MKCSVSFQPTDIRVKAKANVVQPQETDYEKLKNIPTLNGKEIKGNIDETDPTVPSWAKEDKKPTYTAKEVGAMQEGDYISLEELNQMFHQVFSM